MRVHREPCALSSRYIDVHAVASRVGIGQPVECRYVSPASILIAEYGVIGRADLVCRAVVVAADDRIGLPGLRLDIILELVSWCSVWQLDILRLGVVSEVIYRSLARQRCRAG